MCTASGAKMRGAAWWTCVPLLRSKDQKWLHFIWKLLFARSNSTHKAKHCLCNTFDKVTENVEYGQRYYSSLSTAK